MASAKQTSLTVSYSAGVKCNLGHNTFESADFHISRSEVYDVAGLTNEEVEALWEDRYAALKEELDTIAVQYHEDTSGILPERDDD